MDHQRYSDSFVYATQGGIEDDVANSPFLAESSSVMANSSPQSVLNEILAVIMPEPVVESNDLYDLVNSYSQPFTPSNCPYDYQCVRFVQKIMDTNFNVSVAKQIKVNEDQPCENCGVVFWGGSTGHVAYVLKVESPSMEIIDQNHSGCGRIETRSINFEEANNIKGYVK